MEQVINKPRVFLSHSKRDIQFIQRVHDDLRKCQIEPWLDSEEIRHGKPWLDAIFEHGIPTCDGVLVYFTANSIKSKMVKKEIDSGILQKLKDSGVTFLPYVSKAELRASLRLDIQALQTPEWNDGNYYELLPQVVAEIWRSYLERVVSQVRQKEKVLRLEAELELEKIRNQAKIFTDSEEMDFGHIHKVFNRTEEVEIEEEFTDRNDEKLSRVHTFKINHASLIPLIAENYEYIQFSINQLLVDNLMPELLERAKNKQQKRRCKKVELSTDPTKELITFGLLQRIINPAQNQEHVLFRRLGTSYTLVFTDKMQRFRYWLGYHNLMPEKVEVVETKS